jgi:hypothetical protein
LTPTFGHLFQSSSGKNISKNNCDDEYRRELGNISNDFGEFESMPQLPDQRSADDATIESLRRLISSKSSNNQKQDEDVMKNLKIQDSKLSHFADEKDDDEIFKDLESRKYLQPNVNFLPFSLSLFLSFFLSFFFFSLIL